VLTVQRARTQSAASSVSTFYVFFLVIFLALARIVWRTLANYRGTAFSLGRTVVYACVYITLGVLFSAMSYFDGVPFLLAVPEVALAAAATFWSYRYADKRIRFWSSPDGRLYFRGGVSIYLIYLGGFTARLLIDVAFIGPSIFSFGSGVALAGAALYGSMATDLLLIFGVGLLLGRSARVVRRFRMIQRGEETVPDAGVDLMMPLVNAVDFR